MDPTWGGAPQSSAPLSRWAMQIASSRAMFAPTPLEVGPGELDQEAACVQPAVQDAGALAGIPSATTQHAPASAKVSRNSTQLDCIAGLVTTAGTQTSTVTTLSSAASNAADQRG